MNFLTNFFSLYNPLERDSIYFAAVNGILKNRASLQNATIYDVAEVCNVSKSTITRLVKELGYGNFREFRYDMVRAFGRYQIHNHVVPEGGAATPEAAAAAVLSAVRATCGSLEEQVAEGDWMAVAAALKQADTVRFYLDEMPGARSLLTNLAMEGKNVRLLPRYAQQKQDAESLGKGALLFVTDIVHADTLDAGPFVAAAAGRGAEVCMLGAGKAAGPQAAYYLRVMFHSGSVSLHGVNLCFDILSTLYRRAYM